MAFLTVNFFSNALGMCTQIAVILPENTHGQIGMEGHAGKTFPTLYLLHGMSDDHTIWERRTNIERYVADKNIAVVMPTTHLGWYVDTAYGIRYEKYIGEELPEFCRNMFKGMSDKREDTYIAGLSMGGYGAFHYALRHPQTFSAAASLSGALDLTDDLLQHVTDGANAAYWNGIFGDIQKLPGSEFDLFAQAEICKAGGVMPSLYQWCGTDDALLEGGRRMRDHLQKLGFELVYRESDGNHSWFYWDREIQDVLCWIDRLRSR